ncbi:hypothetical protein ACN27G_23430 [Plantactinospora sp. WMMB334]|uniref:hypothetical protein n=1 Tax=Plantactinospora sp. WMMB334 TaxID=3404119 RepID=UPI003B947191
MVRAGAERGMSAPPEVVFNTATDPDRVAAWLPAHLRENGGLPAHLRNNGGPGRDGDGRDGPELATATDLQARWHSSGQPDWSAWLQVSPAAAGGATVRLELEAESDPSSGRDLRAIADESLTSLAREVDDNLSAG